MSLYQEEENRVETNINGAGSFEEQEPVVVPMQQLWSPSGKWWRDLLYFAGSGWLVSIAYIDPGNYQADIQAGATSQYTLLFVVWWTSILSIYVQILCVRLAYFGNMNLAEAQARNSSKRMRYLNWMLAEFSTVITDLPEVIGIGIACNIFFGWPYWVGVVLSLGTTMIFLLTLNCGMRVLEGVIFIFVGIMSLSLFVEMSFVDVDTSDIFKGWMLGFTEVSKNDIFAITGVVGAVVMPHNLYLHTALCQTRPVVREHVKEAVFWSSFEPVLPITVSFFVNLAIIAIATEQVFGTENAASVGLTNFCQFFESLTGGCTLWAVALLAAGQSSAITTTYTGQYVMDGFLRISLPIRQRAILTRLVAITPCVVVSALFPDKLNQLVNIVNALLSVLLPFAFTPLVKFNCSETFMGPTGVARGYERILLYSFSLLVWAVNATALSVEGGGFFGDIRANAGSAATRFLVVLVEIPIQLFYAWWNLNCLITPVQRVEVVALESPTSNEEATVANGTTRSEFEFT